MAEPNLAGIDLNLLVFLDALLADRSVTRAAKRSGVSQPAMSRTLARLRGVFGDELVVRGRQGMVLTPRAESLRAPVRSALAAVELAFADHIPFVPSTARRSFALAISDHGAIAVLPRLVARLTTEAPGIDLRVALPLFDPEQALETNEVDLMIGSFIEPSPGLYSQKLFDEEFVFVVRLGHPVLDDELTLERYAELHHILVTPKGTTGPGQLDDVLRGRGLTRRIALRMPHFLAAALIVADSDLALVIPARVAAALSRDHALAVRPLPVVMPPFPVYQVWHERRNRDDANVWLRKLVSSSISHEDS